MQLKEDIRGNWRRGEGGKKVDRGGRKQGVIGEVSVLCAGLGVLTQG